MPAAPGSPFVSTGKLPAPAHVQELVTEAHETYRSNSDGVISDVYPALARVPGDRFGICVAGTSGALFAVGDAETEFTIMSVAKPFVFALVCEALGPEHVRDRIGVNATGLPFNALAAVEQSADGRTNPMVNPGAIATTSLVPVETAEGKWTFIHSGLSAFAGRSLELDEATYESASATNLRNRDLVRLLEGRDRLCGDPTLALDLYTRQSCLEVSARDLACMGATLADGGVTRAPASRLSRPKRATTPWPS